MPCSFQFDNTHLPVVMPPNDLIDLTVDHRDLLPQAIIDEWLSNEDESVLFLFQEFNQYPPHPSHYILPPNLQSVLHQDEIQSFNYQSLLTIGPLLFPLSPRHIKMLFKRSQHPIYSVTLDPIMVIQ